MNMDLLRRLDEALALIESMTDTVNDNEPARNKIKRAIEIARAARWKDGKLLTAHLYDSSHFLVMHPHHRAGDVVEVINDPTVQVTGRHKVRCIYNGKGDYDVRYYVNYDDIVPFTLVPTT